MSDKCQTVFCEMMKLVPNVNFKAMRERNKGKFLFPMYINIALMETDIEVLDLSVRASHCLHRAGYHTIGELVEAIEGGEDLKKIRNCGDKSIDEIMGNLLWFQYSLISQENKLKYISKILQLNSGIIEG